MKNFFEQWITNLVPAVGWQKHLVLVLFCSSLLVLGLLPEQWLIKLQFESSEQLSYRWLSAHFIHLGFTHAVMNVAGVVVLWLLIVAYLPLRILMVLVIGLPIFISTGLFLDESMAGGYRGFSGAIYGFYAAGVIWHWWVSRTFTVLLSAFLIGKILMEQLPGFDNTYLLSTIGGLVAVDAHLYGALGGVLITSFFVVGAKFGLGFCPKPWMNSNKLCV